MRMSEPKTSLKDGIGNVIINGSGVLPASVKILGHKFRADDVKRVGQRLKQGTVGFRTVAGTASRFDGKAGGPGTTMRYTLTLGRDRGGKPPEFKRSDAVHEAIHISLAFQAGPGGSYRIDTLNNEVLAFTGQAIYLHRKGVLASALADDDYLTAAYPVARKILTGDTQPGIDRAAENLKHVLATVPGSDGQPYRPGVQNYRPMGG
jgi:hypothetical protein